MRRVGTVMVAIFLRQRKHHSFCVFMSGWEIWAFPIGTVLGVFSLATIAKAEVRERFDGR